MRATAVFRYATFLAFDLIFFNDEYCVSRVSELNVDLSRLTIVELRSRRNEFRTCDKDVLYFTGLNW